MPFSASASARPSAVSSAMAAGWMLMPTPSGRIRAADYSTTAPMPRACRARAAVSPPMPPPAMTTSAVLGVVMATAAPRGPGAADVGGGGCPAGGGDTGRATLRHGLAGLTGQPLLHELVRERAELPRPRLGLDDRVLEVDTGVEPAEAAVAGEVGPG